MDDGLVLDYLMPFCTHDLKVLILVVVDDALVLSAVGRYAIDYDGS